MNKRDYKKAVTAMGSGICVEMFNIGMSTADSDMNMTNDCMNEVWKAMDDARNKANTFFGKGRKEFATAKEYNKEKRRFFKTLFNGISTDFSTSIDEALKRFNQAMPKK